MHDSRNRFLRNRTLLLTLSLFLLAAVGAATVRGVRGFQDSTVQVERTYEVIAAITESESAVRSAVASARGFRLTDNPVLQAEYLAALPQAQLALSNLVGALAEDPKQLARARSARQVATARLAELQRLIEIQDSQGMEAAQQAMREQTSIQRSQRFDALTAEMRDAALSLLTQRRENSARDMRWLLAFVVLGMTFSIGLLWTLVRSLGHENRRSRQLESEALQVIQRLEHARNLADRLSEQRHTLSIYSGLLQSCQNLDEAMELTASTLRQLVPHAGGRCYLQRASGNVFESAADFGEESISSSDLLRNEDCWALRRGQPHHTDGGQGKMRCAHLDSDASLAGISTLCVPLGAQGTSLGLLHVNAPSDGGPGDNDAELIESIAEQLSMAIANLQLRESLRTQSIRDPLTGLFNRRYLEENLQRELMRCERRGLPLSLLMIDVDHFKAFNDQHGHAAGDAVLAHVGRTLESMVRNEDLACRYGGEEFTVVLPEAGSDVAIQRAEAVRKEIAWSTLVHLRKTLGPVTVSIGVATFPRDGTTPEVLFELADASLYRAKAEGRDRVVHAAA